MIFSVWRSVSSTVFAVMGSRNEKTMKSAKLGCGSLFLIAIANPPKMSVPRTRMGSLNSGMAAPRMAAAAMTKNAPRYK